jgi:error-prone DNA polymerase
MIDYIPLHVHSYFSLLDGASSPETLVARAQTLGMTALALTDHDALYGAVRFVQAAKSAGIKPLLGAELTLENGHHLTLLAADQTGWGNLSTLITIARHNAAKGQAALPRSAVPDHTSGLFALSGCRRGEIASAVLQKNYQQALTITQSYVDWFGPDHFWIELQNHHLPEDRQLVTHLVALANKVGIGYVATNNVHCAERNGQRLQDVLVSIQHLLPLDNAKRLQRPNSEYYLKSSDEMAVLFRAYPQALANTRHIADACNVELQYGVQHLPNFPTPNQAPALTYLRELCLKGAAHRFGEIATRVVTQLDYELAVIERGNLANYFLIVWDIMRFAGECGIRAQGRGSAANSLVAYLLGISPVDPLKYDLVFERFLSDERSVAPDIDIDFDAARREDIIQYVYDRYDRDHAAMASTLVTFRRKSSLRDVGKALGLPQDTLDTLASLADVHDGRLRSGLDPVAPKMLAHLSDLTDQLLHFPRHLGIHNGAMILSHTPLSRLVPIEPATMPGRTVVQWDKESLEDVGMVKIDILGLRMLSAISDTIALIEQQTGAPVELDRLTFDDPAVYAMIAAAHTIGVFQVESRAQAQMLPRFKPTCFAHLIEAISLIRPGPIQGDMVHPFLRRRLGQEPVTYFHPLLEPVLKATSGIILFQEDVIKVAVALAGFTPGQGEKLRRALGAKDAEEAIETFRTRFIEGAIRNAVSPEIAEQVFDKLRAFGGYSFPKSHAAAFAVIVYQSAWLKRYYPVAFLCALLNNQPMGFWSPAILVNDAKRHQIPVFPVDANRSADKCICEGQGIRIGLNYVKGFGDAHAKRVIRGRGKNPFTALADFCRRAQLPKRLVRNLILAGGFDWIGRSRRQLEWDLGGLPDDPDQLPLSIPEPDVNLSPVSQSHALALQFGMTGVSLHEHPLELYRSHLKRGRVLDSRQVAKSPSGTRVEVAGLNVMHQAPPTAKGFHFVTLEDEYGFINVIVQPQVYAKYRKIIRTAPLLLIYGTAQREGAVTNVLAISVRTMGKD